MDKPEEIVCIEYHQGYADPWVIVIEWPDGEYETISCSDNPSHPQGVFGSNPGNYANDLYPDIPWEELPSRLQTFLHYYVIQGEV